ncbi:MAG TPA: rRNA adenine N(6)-methyltransferase family protein [Streptosporangiaceae bacterium]|nr:rRNA adenine N(6)-methyltransferase family protein [Streptosporangiaceae bacterium]
MPANPAARAPAGRAVRRRVLSQNFLIDTAVIDRLVRGSGVGEGDLVLDIGAGNGLITAALAGHGARVVAIEQDPVLARRLRAKFAAAPGKLSDGVPTVVEGDVLTVALPRESFRVVANLPFGITTKILHHLLDDPRGMLSRADVIVQAEVARKRGTRGRGTLLNACWEPWFEFSTGPRIPPTAFRPRPRVDAAVLIIRSREQPLLSAAVRPAYTEFVTGAFAGAHPTVASALSRVVPRSRFAELAGSLGFGIDALPSQLEAGHWVGLFQATQSRRGEPGHGSGDTGVGAAGRRRNGR